MLILNILKKRKCASKQLSRLRHLGLHEDIDPEELGYEYGKSIFDTDENTVCSIDNDQNVNNKFEIDGFKNCLNGKDLVNFTSQYTNAQTIDPNSLSTMYNLDPEKIKQLQQDWYITKITDKCKSKKNDNAPYYLDKHSITSGKIREGLNIFHAIMVPNTLQPYILYKSHNTQGHNGSTRMYHFIRRHYYWKKIASTL